MKQVEGNFGDEFARSIVIFGVDNQGHSQDLNWLLQDIVKVLTMTSYHDANVIIETPGKNIKIFKYCPISLNMLHTGGLCGVFGVYWTTMTLHE